MTMRWRQRLRQAFHDLRIEGEGTGREAAALGVGIFIGCTPLYGFHLLLCWVVGWGLRLNRLKMYLAANISNPLFSPFLLLLELQTGAWTRRHDLHDLTMATLRQANPWTFGADLFVGSAVVGVLLGLSVAAATYATGGLRRDDPILALLWRRASDPYLLCGITPWEFARGKLRGDPVYRALLSPGMLASGGTLVDVGCGGGLALSVLREAARMSNEGKLGEVPRFERLIGVELRRRAARIAREALQGDAEIIQADATASALPACRAVLLFDVLHMMPYAMQEHLLDRVAAAVETGGVVLIREANANGGLGFLFVRIGNRLKAIATGNWRQRFHFRPHDEWAGLLRRHGMDVQLRAADQGTPFANLLVIGTRRADGPALHEPADPHDRRYRASGGVVLATKPERADGI